MFSGAAVISPLVKTVSAPSLGEMAILEKQLPMVVSAGLQPELISQRRKKREPKRSQLLIQKMTSQYALTPLKMIANELVTLHYDVHPTEISPGLNRSPSFTGKEDKGYELMSGRSSPKLDIPRRRYCGLMIKQHPLVRYCYRMTDRRLARLIKRQLSSSSSSSSSYGPGDYDDVNSDPDDVYDPKDKPVAVKATKAAKLTERSKQVKEATSSAKQQKNVKPIPKEKSYLNMFNEKLGKPKPVKKPVPFSKPSGYLEIYKKKVSFSKKPILPPIGSKPTEDNKPSLILMPTPPSQSRPASSQAASLRSMRKARMEKSQQQAKASTMVKVQ